MIDLLQENQILTISLDMDNAIFDRLKQVAEAGIKLVEINTCEPETLREIIQTFPQLRIGAGNITQVQQLEAVHQAGVQYATSPGLLPELIMTAQIYSIRLIPGVATLSEALQAWNLELAYVKPLPADISFCKLLHKHFPHLKQIPADIDWEQAEQYLTIPSVAAINMCNPERKHLRSSSALMNELVCSEIS